MPVTFTTIFEFTAPEYHAERARFVVSFHVPGEGRFFMAPTRARTREEAYAIHFVYAEEAIEAAIEAAKCMGGIHFEILRVEGAE